MKYLFSLLAALYPILGFAHVKWFSDYSFRQAPLELNELNHPAFWGLLLLTIISMPLLVLLDRMANNSTLYRKTNNFLDRYADNGPLIMRIAMGSVLLMSWQADSIIAPELTIPNAFWGWLELALALLLLFKETTFISGIGVICLWILGITQYGIFHMLDYVVYPAIGMYLILSYSNIAKLKNLDLPMLYSGLGFSLCWVAFEKIFYPYWGLSVLAQAPELAMGMDHKFFLLAAAFVEFSLGYLLMICLLQRPLAIVITLVFFTTTCFFGKTEVVGHTILHGALLVFIVKGPGHYYQAPIRFHKRLWLQMFFVMINFILLFGLMAWPYQKMASEKYNKAMETINNTPKLIIPEGSTAPSVMMEGSKDSMGGWNLHITPKNFKFTPENAGAEDVIGEGHAHLYLNDTKIGRVYGEWFHLSAPRGKHKVKVILNSNTHKEYYYLDKPIQYEIEIEEMRSSKEQHVH